MQLTDDLIIPLFDYYMKYKKDDATLLEIYEDEDILNRVKSFDLNIKIEPSFNACVLLNSWYAWYCANEKFKAPMHYIHNEGGLTVKDILENIQNTTVEGDHVFFEGVEWKGKMWYNLPVFEVYFGS